MTIEPSKPVAKRVRSKPPNKPVVATPVQKASSTPRIPAVDKAAAMGQV